MARRAEAITGPYYEERQLMYPCVEDYEPNQGGINDRSDSGYVDVDCLIYDNDR